MLPPISLILGGARSGKSRYAESLVESQDGPSIYLATAFAGDEEMAARIAAHQARRGGHWHSVEEPLDLVGALHRVASPEKTVLVDCLTLWLSNLMAEGVDVEAEGLRLATSFSSLAGPVVFVSNEVGQGIVPDNALARAFRDHAGWLHQEIAATAGQVIYVVAGLPLMVKGG